MSKPYIIVRHKTTGRAFSMGRNYMVLEEDLGIIDTPVNYIEDCDKWLCLDVPSWVSEIGPLEDISHNFHAFWLY